MSKDVRFFKEYGVCGKKNDITSLQHKLVISKIKFLQKGDYCLSLMRVGLCFFVRVEITSGVDGTHFVS